MTAMSLGLIVAVAPGGVIGRDGRQPWDVPEDLDFFRSATAGRTLIIGRTTFGIFTKPPVGRRLVVLSSRSLGPQQDWPGVQSARSLQEAVALAYVDDPKPFVVGGAQVYNASMPMVSDIWWTDLELPNFTPYPGDTLMPNPPLHEFEVVETHQLSPVATVRHLHRFNQSSDR